MLTWEVGKKALGSGIWAIGSRLGARRLKYT